MGHGAPVGMFGGCHRAPGFIGGAIMVFTTWPWRWAKSRKVATHSSVGFIYQDGYREIYEAREGKSWQGPIPVWKVEAWAAKEPKRRFSMYDIPGYLVSADSACRKLARCEAMKGVWKYSMGQLPRMGLRKYLPFLPINTTPNNVVCSEAATIILGPEVDVCKLTGKSKPDLVTPFDFERAMKLLTSKPKRAPSDVSDAYGD
jgi:hypothetical protein